jgi:hypothetical protein
MAKFKATCQVYRMMEGQLSPASKLLHLNSPGRNKKKQSKPYKNIVQDRKRRQSRRWYNGERQT